MSIIMPLILFCVGLVLVVKGGDWFVDAARWISKAAGIPSFIIGATVVSIATTMPEMIVSVMAAAEGKNEMAIGNAVGSVTVNTALIMALSMIFLPIVIKRSGYIMQCLMLAGSAAVLWAGCMSGGLRPWATVILAAIFVLYIIYNIKEAKKSFTADSGNEQKKSAPTDKKELLKNLLLFVIGAAAIVVGSRLLISGGTDIAELLGVPERVIAVTMVAIGTSLPELVTAISAIRKKEAQLSLGNIIGANIIDLSLILPLCNIISGGSLTVSRDFLTLDFPICLFVTLLAVLPLLIKEKAYKLQGILLVAVYAGYLLLTV